MGNKKNEYGKLIVIQTGLEEITDIDRTCEISYDENVLSFPLESHLRDFIVENIEAIKVNGHSLKLFIDNNDRDGVEYPTGVGLIDILAVGDENNFVVFELKLSKGSDAAMGQISRYMGWVNQNLSNKKKAKGVIVAKNVTEKLKYAAFIIPDISLFEYKLNFNINQVDI